MEIVKENFISPLPWSDVTEKDKRVFKILFIFSLINFFAFSFYAKDFAILRYMRQGVLLVLLVYFFSIEKNNFFIGGTLVNRLSLILKFFIFYAIFNLLTSIDILNSLSYFIWLLLSVLFILNCIHKLPVLENPRSFIYSYSRAFYLSGIIIIIVSLIEGFVLKDHRCFDERYVSVGSGYVLQQQFGGIFGNANMLTMLVLTTMTSLFVTITYSHSEKPFIRKAWDYAVLIGLASLILYVGSRSGLVCLMAAIFLYVIFYKKKPAYLLILIIPMVQYLATHPEFIATQFRTFEFEEGKAYGNRTELIEDAIRIMDKMDFFGVGYANQRIARAKFSVYSDDGNDEDLHFHNTYLALIVELGYIGFAVFVLIIGLVFLQGIKRLFNNLSEHNATIRLLFFLISPVLILGLSEDSINLPGSPVFIYFWLNFIILAYIIDKK